VSKHAQPHPLAGQTVQLNLRRPGAPGPGHSQVSFTVEDYWDRVAGVSWRDANGNPAALSYALRAGTLGLPVDDEVLYGKVGDSGLLVHVSEVLPA